MPAATLKPTKAAKQKRRPKDLHINNGPDLYLLTADEAWLRIPMIYVNGRHLVKKDARRIHTWLGRALEYMK